MHRKTSIYIQGTKNLTTRLTQIIPPRRTVARRVFVSSQRTNKAYDDIPSSFALSISDISASRAGWLSAAVPVPDARCAVLFAEAAARTARLVLVRPAKHLCPSPALARDRDPSPGTDPSTGACRAGLEREPGLEPGPGHGPGGAGLLFLFHGPGFAAAAAVADAAGRVSRLPTQAAD